MVKNREFSTLIEWFIRIPEFRSRYLTDACCVISTHFVTLFCAVPQAQVQVLHRRPPGPFPRFTCDVRTRHCNSAWAPPGAVESVYWDPRREEDQRHNWCIIDYQNSTRLLVVTKASGLSSVAYIKAESLRICVVCSSPRQLKQCSAYLSLTRLTWHFVPILA